MEKMKQEFDRINKEVKYMLLQKSQNPVSEEFEYWLQEKIKYLKELGKKLGYKI